MRKMVSLALAVCLTVPMAVAVSAKEYNNSGTYNGHGWGVHDEWETHRVYIETGSSDDVVLYGEAYHYCYDEGKYVFGGLKRSTPRKKFSAIEDTDTRVIAGLHAFHYMDNHEIAFVDLGE